MKEHVSRARVFVDRYISDGYEGSTDLDKYVNKYEEQVRPMVARVVCARLIEKISLTNYERLLQGLRSLEQYIDGSHVRQAEEKIGEICREYERMKEETYSHLKEQLEEPLKNSWRELGVSGSALEVNVEASPRWRGLLDELDSRYNSLLNGVKQEVGDWNS